MNLAHMTFLSCVALGAFVCGCSSTESTSTPSGSARADSGTTPLETVVTSLAGGTVKAPDGRAVLSIPAGAVSNDLWVTLDVGPRTAETASATYGYQPEGTAFEAPATISIDTDGVTPPRGKKVALAVRLDSAWQHVADAKRVASSVEARVKKLGTFALVFADAEAESACDRACMSKPAAVCCEGCGCKGEVRCTPTCKPGLRWDCELECCFDQKALACR